MSCQVCRRVLLVCALAIGIARSVAAQPPAKSTIVPLEYQIKLETVVTHDDGNFLWFHPRAAPMPGLGRDGKTSVLITLQKHLSVSDFYSGLFELRSDDLGETWQGPTAIPELDWIERPDGEIDSVCDVTPGWHARSGKLLAVGARVRYSHSGEQLDQPRLQQTAYAVFDPRSKKWSAWNILEMPSDERFHFARSACAQWIVEPNGDVLLPIYFGVSASVPSSVAVVRCSFDGNKLKYLRHGNELQIAESPGLYEPSLARFDGRYYLTVRHNDRGYVAVSDDGLNFGTLTPWKFDNDADLGSYNTQQHWLEHSDGLFLVYTRRGADNDHIMRHRAPLFIAQVDPNTLRVVRSTERVLIAERGATLGNFGAATIDASQSWVTVSEGIWNDDARKRGTKGATFVARILWDKPNQRPEFSLD